MKFKYLYYFCDGIGSVFDSQVLELVMSISDKKFFKKVFLVVGIRNNLDKLELQKKKQAEEIKTIYFKSYPNYPQFNFLRKNELRRIFKINKINPEESLFHTRGELLPYNLIGIISRQYAQNILPDIRGLNVEEILEFSELNKIQKTLKVSNYKKALSNLNRFKYISVVSPSLAEHLANMYLLNLKKIMIVPCLAGRGFSFDQDQRIKTRKELNLTELDNLIVFSSAGNALWQNISVLKLIANRGIKILNLSKNTIEHKNIINKFVDYNLVPKYLNASDVGLIWRDKSIVNEVASPVKFSEFICCGLPIVANDSVKMITNYIKNFSFGKLLNDLNELSNEDITRLKFLNRQEIANKGQELLGIDRIIENYFKIYTLF